MATWLAHLRVAELISAELRAPWLSEPDFLAGNVAPDCGIPVPGGFDPPKESRTGLSAERVTATTRDSTAR